MQGAIQLVDWRGEWLFRIVKATLKRNYLEQVAWIPRAYRGAAACMMTNGHSRVPAKCGTATL